jgi:lipopolysaccharide transport system permease protein
MARRRFDARPRDLVAGALSAERLYPGSVQEVAATTFQASDPREGTETVRLQPTRGFGRVLAPRELWRFRDVARQLAARDITVRYRQTALGAAWAVLQPVGTMIVFSIFFGHLAGLSSDGVSYPLFSLAALVPWTFFANALVLGSDSLVSNSALVSKIYFPRIFIPAGVIFAGLVDLGIGLLVLLAVALATGLTPSAAILLLPLFALIMVAAAFGVTSAFAATNVRYRDVRYIVPFVVQLWLFATPVAYSSSLLGSPWRTLSGINPMVGVVEGFRWAVLDTPNSPWAVVGVSAASAVLLLGGGLAYFDRVERRFADVL